MRLWIERSASFRSTLAVETFHLKKKTNVTELVECNIFVNFTGALSTSEIHPCSPSIFLLETVSK